MTDEWSMFGSDDEDELDANVEPSSTVSGSSPLIASALERASDTIVTESTQKFVKMDHTIALSRRYFGVMSSSAMHTAGGIYDFLGSMQQSLSKKIKQRGMIVKSSSCSAPSDNDMDKDKPGFDGASIIGLFELISMSREDRKNILQQISLHQDINSGEDSKNILQQISLHQEINSGVRKKLTVGGFLMVTTVIQSSIMFDDTDWTPQALLQQWAGNESCKEKQIFPNSVWDIENANIIHHQSVMYTSVYTVCVTKRACAVNTLSCVWKTNNKKVPQTYYDSVNDVDIKEKWIDFERRILSNATVTQSIHEQREGLMTRASIDQAVKALQMYGFVVLPGLFRNSPQQINAIQDWSKATLEDFDMAISILKSKYNVDILNPGEGSDPLSYREMAMREDFRVDLRDGPNISKLRRTMEDIDTDALDSLGYIVMDGGEGMVPSIIDKKDSTQILDESKVASLRFNPFVLDIVRKLQNPHIKEDSQDGPSNQPIYKGNFGRWNFSGSGPNGSPQPIRVGQIGSVISLPGAADQCIHADTAHIFETQDCLPCHYANLFILGEDSSNYVNKNENEDADGNFNGENLIGGTAFVAGSHQLSVTARMTADSGISAAGDKENSQNELHMRTIRPSLQLGDAIIFDTRTLHFGLANRTSTSGSTAMPGLRRPLLYVNLTHSWFFDPKNWDNNQSIFLNDD
jgi:hypothetical protein